MKKIFPILNLILIFLILTCLILISYLLVTREQNWSKLNITQLTSHSVSLSSSQKSEEISQPSQEDTSKLIPYKNHNQAAADYAYDVKTIRQYLTGEIPYNGDNLVFITIDDGANHVITPPLLDILQEQGVHATFFPIGANITNDTADLFRREIREGHAIGLHSFSHDLSLLYPGRVPDTQQIVSEANEAQKALKRVLGLKFQTHLWRYPGGALSWKGLEEANDALAQIGLEWIDWNAYLGDAEPMHLRPQTLDEMIAFHTKSLESFPNSPDNLKVVLLHDAPDKQLTLEALPYIIQYYKDNGYTFGVLE